MTVTGLECYMKEFLDRRSDKIREEAIPKYSTMRHTVLGFQVSGIVLLLLYAYYYLNRQELPPRRCFLWTAAAVEEKKNLGILLTASDVAFVLFASLQLDKVLVVELRETLLHLLTRSSLFSSP